MATLGVLIARIEARLSQASGLDVQIHAEPTLLEMLRHKYNTMFDDHWWFDYLTFETFTLDGTTGQVTTDLTNKIRRFIDIQSVYYGNLPHPLPLASVGTNLLNNFAYALLPSTDPTKVFKLIPATVTGTVSAWYRTRLSDTQWESGDDNLIINMDDELLITGTAFDYMNDDGTNPDATKKLESEYASRLQQLIGLGQQQPILKRRMDASMPTQWWPSDA